MKLSLAPLGALALGGAAALCALAMPTPTLEGLVMDSGLPAVFAAAEPPLGLTARAAVALGAGGFAAIIGFLAMFVVFGTRGFVIGRTHRQGDDVTFPTVRRADAHPDAPPRPPVLATRDLGTPFLEIRAHRTAERVKATEALATRPIEEPEEIAPAEQPLPRDLNQPLAAFDPEALPDVPLAAPEVLPALQRPPKPPVFEENERFEVYELKPPVPPAPAPARIGPAVPLEERITRPETEASVHALLERLERGVARKTLAPTAERFVERRKSPRGLEDTLVTLRNLARRA